jgi:hypothetical protein
MDTKTSTVTGTASWYFRDRLVRCLDHYQHLQDRFLEKCSTFGINLKLKGNLQCKMLLTKSRRNFRSMYVIDTW